jgi:dihydrofolate synthase/folylpolyglutamate synthase
MNILGDTLEKIAIEKAGIIKTGVPVVIGEIIDESQPIFEKIAFEKNAPLSIASKKRQAVQWHWNHHDLVVELAEEHKTDHKIFRLDLAGIYQTKNLITVVEACWLLKQKGWKITNESMLNGLQQAKKLTGLHGRWEIIDEHPMIVLDVAHNEDGIRQILEHLEMVDHHQLHFITGMVNDKEIDKVLKLLPSTANYYFTQSHIPRALPVELLMQKAAVFGLQGKSFPDVNTALKTAKSNAGKSDLIIVCGSVFLVAEVER